MSKSISSKLNAKFKLILRILTTSLDKLVCLAKNIPKILSHKCIRRREKITWWNPLKEYPHWGLPKYFIKEVLTL